MDVAYFDASVGDMMQEASPESKLDPALVVRAEAAVGDLETALHDLQCAIAQLHSAFAEMYPPDGTEAWYAAWEEGRLGAVWDRLERLNVQDVIEAALGPIGVHAAAF